MDPPPVLPAVNLVALFPGDVAHCTMHYLLHVWGLRNIPSQTRLIEYEGLKNIKYLANCTDAELDTMAAATRIQMGLARTKALKAVTFWVIKKCPETAPRNLRELTQHFIAALICKMALNKNRESI
jgi:hypothetical protein